MAIYLEDLNTTTATETAFTELRSLYMKSDEWKHFESGAKLLAITVVKLISKGKVIPGEKISSEYLEKLSGLVDTDVVPTSFRIATEYLFNHTTFETDVKESDVSDFIMSYWKGVTEERYYMEEFASDACVEFDSTGKIVEHSLELDT